MNSTASSNSSSVTSSLLDGRPDKDTAGPILVQGFLQYLCQGVIISQSAKFYHRWQDDPVALRVYVVVLLFCSLIQTVLESYKTWVETIVGVHWWTSRLHCTEFLCNALICIICEAFLIRRCYRITQRNPFVLVYLSSLLIISLVASICLTIRIAQVIGPLSQNGMADPLHASMYAYPLWVYVTLFMALSLTIILSVSLWRTRTGLRHLDRTLNHIIFITFESAVLPTACMLVSAVIYSIRDAQASSAASASLSHVSPGASGPGAGAESPAAAMRAQTLHLDLFFAILTGKVYTLGLLRTLNSRTQFRAGMHTSNLGRRSLTGWDFATADADAQARGPGGGVGCSWAGSGVGPRGSCASGAPGRGQGYGGEYHRDHEGRDESCSSEETVRVSEMDCDQLSIRSIPSAHYTAPKVRKSFSRNPEHTGPRHSVY